MPGRYAELAMYVAPQPVQVASEQWLTRIVALLDAPRRDGRGLELLELFRSPDLLLTQTCGYPLMTLLRDKMNRKISQSGLDATTRYELHTRLEGMPKHRKLCHGDFNPKNIIIAPDGVAYILDWAHATQGNASADVARTYLLFWLDGDISGAEAYLDLFCQKSDTARQYVQKWIPIVAASQIVKGNAKEREFLLRWANVVDYE